MSQKRARHDTLHTNDVNPSSYLGPPYNNPLALYNRLPDTEFALYHPHLAPTHPNPHPHFDPAHSQPAATQSLYQYQQQAPSYWGLPVQRLPQHSQPLPLPSQPHLQPGLDPQTQSLPQTPQQYYNMPADHVQNAAYSANTDWWQPRPSSNSSVLDNWNYQIGEPCVYGADASQHLKLQSLATLDNLVRFAYISLSALSLIIPTVYADHS